MFTNDDNTIYGQQKLTSFFPEIIPQKTFEPLKTTREERGKMIAEACGIEVVGDNKWITLIQNASHPTMLNIPEHPTRT